MKFIPWDEILSSPTVQRNQDGSNDGITTYRISKDATVWVTDAQRSLAQAKADGHPLCLVMDMALDEDGKAQVYRIIDFQ